MKTYLFVYLEPNGFIKIHSKCQANDLSEAETIFGSRGQNLCSDKGTTVYTNQYGETNYINTEIICLDEVETVQ